MGLRREGLSGVCFVFQFGYGGLVEGSFVFEALWSGRKALCTRGASVALPGERSVVLKLRPLRRYLRLFFPCIGIWIL